MFRLDGGLHRFLGHGQHGCLFIGSRTVGNASPAVGTIDVVVALHVTGFKVEDALGVDVFAQEAGLDVEVGTRGTSRITAQSDGLTTAHYLVLAHQVTGHVSIDGFESVGVTDDHVVTIALALIGHHPHLAVKDGADGVAHIDLDVGAVVVAAERTAVAVVGGHEAAVAGHAEATQVDAELPGHGHAVGTASPVVPGGVQVTAGVLQIIEEGARGGIFLEHAAQAQGIDHLHLLINGGLACQQVLGLG